jgi:hypothetical protein
MTRGQRAQDGDTFVNKNGYHHTRVNGSWMATHRLVAEQKLGRPLGEDEFVAFADLNRSNLHPDNIVIKKRGKTSARRRHAQLVARIDELYAELEEVCKELGENPPRFPGL